MDGVAVGMDANNPAESLVESRLFCIGFICMDLRITYRESGACMPDRLAEWRIGGKNDAGISGVGELQCSLHSALPPCVGKLIAIGVRRDDSNKGFIGEVFEIGIEAHLTEPLRHA